MTTAVPYHKHESTKMEYAKPAYKPVKECLISILIGLHQVPRSKVCMMISYYSSLSNRKELATNPPLSIRDWQMEWGGFAAAYLLQSSALPSYAVMKINLLTTTQPKHCTSYFKDCVPLLCSSVFYFHNFSILSLSSLLNSISVVMGFRLLLTFIRYRNQRSCTP